MSIKPHALIIGGTGMLAPVCYELAKRGYMLSVLARGREGLISLKERFGANSLSFNPIHVDYRDSTRMRALIETAVVTYGPVELCVSWIHSTAPAATCIVAESVDTGPDICRYYDLRPSWTGAPDAAPWPREMEIAPMEFVDYCGITLGFVIEEAGSRWLRNEDIATGVLAAIDSGEREWTIGTVTPWEARPPRSSDRR